jgi:hypothetical protein
VEKGYRRERTRDNMRKIRLSVAESKMEKTDTSQRMQATF